MRRVEEIFTPSAELADIDPHRVDREELIERLQDEAGEQYDAARGRPGRGAHARARALPAAADHRPALARAPLRHGLPARGHPPARVRPDRAAGGLQERGLRALPRPDEQHLGRLRSPDLPRRGRRRGPQRRGAPASCAAPSELALELEHRGAATSPTPAAAPHSPARWPWPPRVRPRRRPWPRRPPTRRSSSAESARRSRSAATIPAGAGQARSTRSATAPDRSAARPEHQQGHQVAHPGQRAEPGERVAVMPAGHLDDEGVRPRS